MEQPSFTYDPLPPGSIRLVRVTTCTDRQIQCEIKTSPLELESPWLALSYVWGTSPEDQTIWLNGYQAKVTPNLLKALRAISNAPANDPLLPDELWIWIDALCINQNDIEEKSVQVPLMGELFSRARSVFVWFGEYLDRLVLDVLLWLDAKLRLDSEGSRHDFWLAKLDVCHQRLEGDHCVGHLELEALYSLYTYTIRNDSFKTNMTVQEAFRAWQAAYKISSSLFPPGHAFWNGLANMIGHEWYRRIWTYQEINLAVDACLLLPDDLMSYWPIERLSWISVQVVQGAEPQTKTEFDNFSLAAASGFGLRIGNKPDRALAAHLVRTRGRQARDDKDVVFGLLGMVRPEVREVIVVDYALHAQGVFAGAVAVAVTLESPVNLPYIWEQFCDIDFGTSKLPSWCPALQHRSRGLGSIGGRLDVVSDGVWEKFHDYGAVAAAVESCPTLIFSAWMLDEVLHSGDRIPKMTILFKVTDPDNVSGEIVVRMIRAIVEFNKWLVVFDNTFPWVDTSVGNARLHHLLEFASPTKPGSNNRIDVATVAAKIVSLCLAADTSNLEAMKMIQQDLEANVNLIMLSMLYLDEVLALVHQHNIFETSSGKIGYSTQPVSRGDIIIYVPGGWNLHIVSKEEKRYRGVARVEGLMEDAVLTVIEDPERSIQRFSVI